MNERPEELFRCEQQDIENRPENSPRERDTGGIQDDILKSFFRLIKASAVFIVCFFVLKQYSAWLENSDSFIIRKIEIEGNELANDQNITKETGLEPGKRIWEVDLQTAEKRIKSNPFVETVNLERFFPNVLKIHIQEKYPIALLNFNNRFYSVDEKGTILPSKPGKLYDLPVLSIHFKGGAAGGKSVDSLDVKEGLNFLKRLIRERAELYGEISELVIEQNQELTLYTRKGGIPVHIGEGGYEWKIRYLEAVVNKIFQKSEIQKIRYIDLRYNNQVVVGERA